MKYKVTLNGRTYEVEVEAGKAMLLDEYEAIRLIDDMLAKRNGEKRHIQERDYASMYPYESIEELIEDGLVKDVSRCTGLFAESIYLHFFGESLLFLASEIL